MSRLARETFQQRHIAALARRAALHQGAVRQLLDDKLRALQRVEAADTGHAPAAPPPRAATSPLAGLLAHIAGPSQTPAQAQAAPGTQPSPRELKAVRDYRSTWSRLSVEQRVNQALARVPPNAGPLNTQRLVHQALTALRDASPAYLHRLVTQVEALLWLERVGQQGGPAPKKAGAVPQRPTGSGRS